MGRARVLNSEMHCHSCNRQWWGRFTILDDHMRSLHALDPHNPCARCEAVHGDGTICKYLPETCTCATPHVEIIRRNRRGEIYAQVRADQRAVVYRMPDGTISAPSSNRYDDEIAVDAVSRGGVRYEFPTVRSMVAFQREHRKAEGDEFSERSLVIDYDQSTIMSGDTLLREGIKREDQSRRELYENQLRGEVHFGGAYYEHVRNRRRAVDGR